MVESICSYFSNAASTLFFSFASCSSAFARSAGSFVMARTMATLRSELAASDSSATVEMLTVQPMRSSIALFIARPE